MNKVVGFIAGVIIASALLYWMMPAVDSNEVDKWWVGLSDSQLEKRMKSATLEELQNFVNYTNHEELSERYVYQSHVVNAAGREDAIAAVKSRYPEFTVNSREEYNAAIRADPVKFRAYAHELTSVRIYFNHKRAGRLN